MSLETLQLAVLAATGAVVVLVPLLIILLASRIRNAAHESTHAALAQSTRKHADQLAEFTRQHERALGETIRQHESAINAYARQHERAMAELSAEHRRIAQEFGMFSRKRHAVYARLYSRYRTATRDLAAALTGQEPEFQKFSRDDLLRYLKGRNIRERDAADAVAAMDRGDVFAMGKLMSRLHWRATLRDGNAAFDRARDYETLNELYLSDPVREAVGNVRRKVESLTASLSREQERGDQPKRLARQDELHSAVASLLHAMRDDLRGGAVEVKSRPRLELERTPPRVSLPQRTSTQLADKVIPPVPADTAV